MKLLELELSGFKSFAHATTFQFTDGLTAIIGPNGSGKSNVTEAIRWVLGEQSLKNLRGRESTDVIFAGSTTVPARGFARVSLTLSNESGRFPLEAAEIVLTRRLDRSGESEYHLNGDPVRAFEVQRLLAEAGIGTKSYAVISQGTVDRYLTATPAARRELFDEACGIKGLQLRLARAERTLATAAQGAGELAAILAELEPRRRLLERAMRQQAKRHILEQQYAALHRAALHTDWHDRTAAVQQATAVLAAATETAEQCRAEREAVETELLQRAEQADTAPTRHPRSGSTRTLLQRCKELLDALLAQQPVTRDDITALRQTLADHLTPHAVATGATPPLRDALARAHAAELEAERARGAAESEHTRAEAQLAALTETITAELGGAALPELAAAPPATAVTAEAVEAVAAELAAIGTVDPQALAEYEAVQARTEQLATQLADIYATETHTKQLIASITAQMHRQFRTQFTAIQAAFAENFRTLFGGGHAALSLIEAEPAPDDPDPVTAAPAGIDILAHPPGKKLRHVAALSGGEKALTALALLCAILQVQRPPFLVLDEVDAALDEANSHRFATMLTALSATTQCIVISHNRETMGHADVLYGITMSPEGTSTVYSVKMDDLVPAAAA